MTGTVDNGRRVDVVFPGYTGKAGVVDRDGQIEVAFPGEARRLRNIKPGVLGLVDGAGVSVISVEDAKYVKGMVVLMVEPVAAE